MARDMFIYTGVFAASLGLAWWASLPASMNNPERRALVSIDAPQVGKIEYGTPDVKVVITPGESGDKFWISMEKTVVSTNPNAPAPASSKDRFLASAKLKDVFSAFHPYEALRVIGKVKDEGLGEYGLADSKKYIKISDRSGGEVFSLIIGKQAYGTRNIFAMDAKEKSVILVAGDTLGEIEKADIRLYERMISNIPFDEIQRSEIRAGSKSRKLLHTRRDEKGALIWTDDGIGDGSSAVASAKSWFERLDRVRVVAFAKDDETAKLKDAPTIFEVVIEASGGSKEHFVYKKATASGAGPADYWVYSDYLGTYAKVGVTRLEPIEKDLPSVLEH